MKKLKGSVENITVKSLLILMITGIAVLVPIRCYQMFAMVEGGTGFWKTHNFTIPLFYIIFAVIMVCSSAMSFAGAKIPRLYSKKPDPLIGAGGLILALSMVVDAATQFLNFYDIVTNWKEFSPSDYGMIKFLLISSSFALPLQGLLAILSALYFMMFGFYYLSGLRSLDDFKALAITPVFWCVIQMVYRFARTINFISVSELLLELLLIAFMMLFFLNFSRLISAVGTKDGVRPVFAYGIPAAVLGFLCSVPRLFLILIGKGTSLTERSPFTFWYLAAALFIVFCLIRMFEYEPEAEAQAAREAEEAEAKRKAEEEAKKTAKKNARRKLFGMPPIEVPAVGDNSASAEEAKAEEVKPSPKAAAPAVEKFSMEALENNTPVKSEPKKEERKASPKVAAPVVEKFSMEALENNTPVKSEPKKEERQASPKVAAPVVEKFSMEALENNTPVKSEPKKEERKASPKVAAPVVEKFSMEALENNTPVKSENADEERFSLEAFINSDAFEKDEEVKKEVEIEHFDLETFLANLEEKENSDK